MTRSLEEELRDPGLSRLLEAARARYEALGGVRGRVRVQALGPEEALAIDTVLRRSSRHRPRRGREFSCLLVHLDASLRETLGVDLETALTRVGGPLHPRPQQRAVDAAQTDAFWEQALGDPLCRDEPRVGAWVERLRHTGALGTAPWRTDRGPNLLTSLRIAATLPHDPPIERSTFANELLGDPHGLDDGTAVGDRLVALLAARDGRSGERMTAGERRLLFKRFGVLCDPASATVLTLGLRPVGDSPLEQALRLLVGSHVVLTLGQLSRVPMRFRDGETVHVCENPAVVIRAEERLGPRAAPLVCTSGWPGSAVCTLLDHLRAAGASFIHHGDFDWEGLAIHRWLGERYEVKAWRFDAAAYETAVSDAPPGAVLKSARHRHPATDPLAQALDRHQVAVYEEVLLDQLVGDLAVPEAWFQPGAEPFGFCPYGSAEGKMR